MGQQSTRHENALHTKDEKVIIELCYKFEMQASHRHLIKSNVNLKDIFVQMEKQSFSHKHKNRVRLFRLQVKFGADVDTLVQTGKAIIHYACIHPGRDCQLLKQVIAAKADVNTRCLQTGSTPLHLCCGYNFNYQSNNKGGS